MQKQQKQSVTIRRLRLFRRALWIALPVVVLSALGAYLWTDGARLLISTKSANPLISGKFSLVDHNGRTVTDADYNGKWRLMFFGFTHCPDVCSTTLNTMAVVMGKLGSKANKIVPLFVSVDPARDKPAVLKEYVLAFHPRMIGLSGSDAQVEAAAKAFRVYYGKASGAGNTENYLVDHSAIVFLMDTEGRFSKVFSHNTDIEKIVSEIRQRL